MTRNPILWHFIQDTELRWHWRRLLVDHTVSAQSEAFDDYGRCVSDAIRNGFNPGRQGYSSISGNRTTDYRVGEPPETRHR
jgi:hypothetical protein